MYRLPQHRGIAVLTFVITAASFIAARAADPPPYPAVADTYVDQSQSSTNFGRLTYLKADSSPTNTAYLRFNVQNAGTVASATLRFYVLSSGRLGLDVHRVASTSWSETSMTYSNKASVGGVVGHAGPLAGGQWYSVNVSSIVNGDGAYSFALTTPGDTAIKIASRESSTPPQLVTSEAPAVVPTFVVTRTGTTSYQAASATKTFTGSLKLVGESAVADLEAQGGGVVSFGSGVFDFGTEHFELNGVHDIIFAGEGIDVTTLQNQTDEAADTEPFDFTVADRVTIRDMTVRAGGTYRSTSDAIDFDAGNNNLVERVKVNQSRARGIVFDGKGIGINANGNTVRDCIVTGVPHTGIQLLASSNNVIEGCTITNVGRHGIQVAKSSASAPTPNKKSNDNVIRDNRINQAGQDGINVNSCDRNRITGNTITNSADELSGRDGIRISFADNVTAEDNLVLSNTATDNQATKTQAYGLNLTGALVERTTVGGNDFSGNLRGEIHDLGTGTSYT